MTTASTQGLIQLFSARILDFTPASGDTLRTRLGGGTGARLYTEIAEADAAYPYAVQSWKSMREAEGYAGLRIDGEFEVQIYDRPQGQRWRAEGIADVIQQACLMWGDGASGVTFSRYVRRLTLPLLVEPMDRELVRLAVFVPVSCWPVMLSQYVL